MTVRSICVPGQSLQIHPGRPSQPTPSQPRPEETRSQVEGHDRIEILPPKPRLPTGFDNYWPTVVLQGRLEGMGFFISISTFVHPQDSCGYCAAEEPVRSGPTVEEGRNREANTCQRGEKPMITEAWSDCISSKFIRTSLTTSASPKSRSFSAVL